MMKTVVLFALERATHVLATNVQNNGLGEMSCLATVA